MSNHNYIERSLLGVVSFFKESLYAEEYASRKGFLQSLDPRIKMTTLLLFLLQILFTKSLLVIMVLYGICLVLVYVSEIGLGFFLKKTWIFIPIFSLFIALPAIFNFVTPGETWVSWKIGGLNFIITRQGVMGAILFVSRVITSVSHVILFSLTTKHFELLKVLRVFKVPQVFVMVLGMCYRYLYLFMGLVESTYLAIKSRVGSRTHYRQGRQIVAWNITYLWTRSFQTNEEVYQAMLSRGYRGEPKLHYDFQTHIRDWIWLLAVVGVIVGIGYFNIRGMI